jgi:MoxR-like ATPase
MRARVKNGQWVLDDPKGLPEGTEVEIVTRAVQPAGEVYLDAKLRDYVHALLVGAYSPKHSAARGSPSPEDENELIEQAKAHARGANRSYTTPADITSAAPGILRRIVRVPSEAMARNVTLDQAIGAILDETPLP